MRIVGPTMRRAIRRSLLFGLGAGFAAVAGASGRAGASGGASSSGWVDASGQAGASGCGGGVASVTGCGVTGVNTTVASWAADAGGGTGFAGRGDRGRGQ